MSIGIYPYPLRTPTSCHPCENKYPMNIIGTHQATSVYAAYSTFFCEVPLYLQGVSFNGEQVCIRTTNDDI